MEMDINHLRNVLKMIIKNKSKHCNKKFSIGSHINFEDYSINDINSLKAEYDAEDFGCK